MVDCNTDIKELMANMSEDVYLHQFITVASTDVVRFLIESALCRAAEAENDQPTIFPMSA